MSREPEFEALRKFIDANCGLPLERIAQLVELISAMRMADYARGVKAGYLKVIQDHRAGYINIPDAHHHSILKAIQAAQEGTLSPSDFFKAKP